MCLISAKNENKKSYASVPLTGMDYIHIYIRSVHIPFEVSSKLSEGPASRGQSGQHSGQSGHLEGPEWPKWLASLERSKLLAEK